MKRNGKGYICNYPIRYLAYYPVIPKNTHYWWGVYTIVGVSVPLFLGYSVFYLTLRLKKVK